MRELLMLGLMLALMLPASSGYEFSNAAISACARAGRAAGIPWLTRNNQSYICTDEQWDRYYDPASSIAYFAINPDVTAPTALACPKPGTSIKCFVFSSWGQVAGGPDACTDKCSTQMLTGEHSCCGKACTVAPDHPLETLHARTPTTAKCTNNSWIKTPTARCGNKLSDGYCDCCPDCYDCVHPAETRAGRIRRSLVANRFCDCRNGTEVSSDYSPCWNSCLDCLGDDGQVAYMPHDLATECVGRAECWIRAVVATKTWSVCNSSEPSSCVATSHGKADIPNMPKAKGAALCA